MRTKQQVSEIVRRLEECYPLAECTLDYKKDYELLFSVRLAAQCTDARVNEITPALFARFPTLESFAEADVADARPLRVPTMRTVVRMRTLRQTPVPPDIVLIDGKKDTARIPAKRPDRVLFRMLDARPMSQRWKLGFLSLT